MENATKALLIAGGVLIAIIILSIGVYLYVIFSRQANNYKDVITINEIEKFNSIFEVYIGREDITPQEVSSVYNISKEYSKIEVLVLKKNGETITMDNSNPEVFLKQYIEKTFKCTNTIYNNEGTIKKIVFKEKT